MLFVHSSDQIARASFLAALPRDVFATEIMTFDYDVTVSMKGQEKVDDVPSIFFFRFPGFWRNVAGEMTV